MGVLKESSDIVQCRTAQPTRGTSLCLHPVFLQPAESSAGSSRAVLLDHNAQQDHESQHYQHKQGYGKTLVPASILSDRHISCRSPGPPIPEGMGVAFQADLQECCIVNVDLQTILGSKDRAKTTDLKQMLDAYIVSARKVLALAIAGTIVSLLETTDAGKSYHKPSILALPTIS